MPKIYKLPAGVYVVTAPVHIDGDDGRFSDAASEAVVHGEGVCFDHVTATGKVYRAYVFHTRYGSGTFPLWVGDQCAGQVDTDDGVIAVVPIELVRDCGSDYTKWLVARNHNQFTALFQLEQPYQPTFENWQFVLDDIVLDTTDLSFVPEEDRDAYQARIEALAPGDYLSREITAYLTMNIFFQTGELPDVETEETAIN